MLVVALSICPMSHTLRLIKCRIVAGLRTRHQLQGRPVGAVQPPGLGHARLRRGVPATRRSLCEAAPLTYRKVRAQRHAVACPAPVSSSQRTAAKRVASPCRRAAQTPATCNEEGERPRRHASVSASRELDGRLPGPAAGPRPSSSRRVLGPSEGWRLPGRGGALHCGGGCANFSADAREGGGPWPARGHAAHAGRARAALRLGGEHRDLGEGAPGLGLCGPGAAGEGLSRPAHLANRAKLALLRLHRGPAARPPGLGDFV